MDVNGIFKTFLPLSRISKYLGVFPLNVQVVKVTNVIKDINVSYCWPAIILTFIIHISGISIEYHITMNRLNWMHRTLKLMFFVSNWLVLLSSNYHCKDVVNLVKAIRDVDIKLSELNLKLTESPGIQLQAGVRRFLITVSFLGCTFVGGFKKYPFLDAISASIVACVTSLKNVAVFNQSLIYLYFYFELSRRILCIKESVTKIYECNDAESVEYLRLTHCKLIWAGTILEKCFSSDVLVLYARHAVFVLVNCFFLILTDDQLDDVNFRFASMIWVFFNFSFFVQLSHSLTKQVSI